MTLFPSITKKRYDLEYWACSNGSYCPPIYTEHLEKNGPLLSVFLNRFPSHCSTWNKLIIWNILIIKNIHLKAIFCKRGRFRAKSHEIKVVGNALSKTLYFITFFPGMHPLAVNDIILSSPRALRFSRSFHLNPLRNG